MVQVVLFIFIIAVAIFLWLKNKQENRSIEKHNRMLEKQDELLEMLRKKGETGNKEKSENEN